MDRLVTQLQRQRAQGLLRELHAVERPSPGRLLQDGHELADFGANDYLGLTSHPRLKEAAREALERWGTGTGASRLLSGTLVLHDRLEQRLAAFKGKPAALIFNSGYQANVGLLAALCEPGDVVLVDRLAHASLLDGLTLARVRWHRFAHNDPEHLEFLLRRRPAAWIVTESVFSMDGDLACLDPIVTLAERYGSRVLLDEAHATGLWGPGGSGLAAERGLVDRIDVLMGTFSKALGSFGAYVACSETIRRVLVNRARSFIYTTSLPPAVVAANLAALDVVQEEPQRRRRVHRLAETVRATLQARGQTVLGQSPIVPWIVGTAERAVELSRALRERGCYVPAIRPPTVPRGQSRLRISLSAAHGDPDIERLQAALVELTDVRAS